MTPRRHIVAFVLCLSMTAACRGGEAPGGAAGAPPGGGMPPMPVEVVTLTPKPVEHASEYVATVKSRSSSLVQPQVDGFVTRINARPGQRVARGAVLMQIDSGRQEATVATLESMRAARQSDLELARQHAERAKKLLEAGATSQQEFERAQAALQTAQAQVNAINAQIREQRVQLGYHNVVALTSGVVGDIPVRVGDRVTPQTVLTTIDENAGFELYISVPVQQSPALKNGLTVRIIDETGAEVGASQINFVATSVDPATQSVLAKAPLHSRVQLRPDQFVRVRVVWSFAPGLTVPLVAVTRVNNQHFVYIAEKGASGSVAKQRPVALGTLVGNDYVVQGGLKPGEQLIVTNIQKIGDGAPVQPSPAGAAATPPPAGGR